MPYTSEIAPAAGATTIGAAASGVGLPLALGLKLWSASKKARQKRAEANAQVAAAGGNPNPAFPGRDQYGRAQVENPDNPGFDMAGWPMTYAEGPGSGPNTNPIGAVTTVADIAAGSIPRIRLRPGSVPTEVDNQEALGRQAPIQTPAPTDDTMPTTNQQSLVSSILPTAISAGISILGGYLQSRAASRAATTQADSAERAAEINREAGREALAFNREALAQQQANQQPWVDAGTGSLRTIGDMVKDPGYGFTQTFKAPTPKEAMMDPGIQFQLQQGSRALEASLKAKGLSLSGKAVKEINELAQGIAGQGYQNVYNRSKGEFDTAYNLFANERASRLNPLLSMAGLGQTSVGQLNSAIGNAGSNAANITLGTAANVTDQQTSAAASRASGYAAGGNIWGNTLGNIGNTIQDTITLRELMKRFPVTA